MGAPGDVHGILRDCLGALPPLQAFPGSTRHRPWAPQWMPQALGKTLKNIRLMQTWRTHGKLLGRPRKLWGTVEHLQRGLGVPGTLAKKSLGKAAGQGSGPGGAAQGARRKSPQIWSPQHLSWVPQWVPRALENTKKTIVFVLFPTTGKTWRTHGNLLRRAPGSSGKL